MKDTILLTNPDDTLDIISVLMNVAECNTKTILFETGQDVLIRGVGEGIRDYVLVDKDKPFATVAEIEVSDIESVTMFYHEVFGRKHIDEVHIVVNATFRPVEPEDCSPELMSTLSRLSAQLMMEMLEHLAEQSIQEEEGNIFEAYVNTIE